MSGRIPNPGSAARIRRWQPKRSIFIWGLASSSLHDRMTLSKEGMAKPYDPLQHFHTHCDTEGRLEATYPRSSTLPNNECEYPAFFTGMPTEHKRFSAFLKTARHIAASATSTPEILPLLTSITEACEAYRRIWLGHAVTSNGRVLLCVP